MSCQIFSCYNSYSDLAERKSEMYWLQEHPVVPSDIVRDVPEAGREGGREGRQR